MHDDEDDPPDSGDHPRAGARARAPKDEPYQDPIDERARTAKSIDDRVYAIAQLIAQGRWSKLKALQYANLWAVKLETVRSYGKDAARMMRALAGKPKLETVRTTVARRLDTAYELAIASGDPKAATAAAKALGDLYGVNAPKKPEGGGQGDGLSEAQRATVQLFMIPQVFQFFASHQRLPSPDELRQLIQPSTVVAQGIDQEPPGG